MRLKKTDQTGQVLRSILNFNRFLCGKVCLVIAISRSLVARGQLFKINNIISY